MIWSRRVPRCQTPATGVRNNHIGEFELARRKPTATKRKRTGPVMKRRQNMSYALPQYEARRKGGDLSTPTTLQSAMWTLAPQQTAAVITTIMYHGEPPAAAAEGVCVLPKLHIKPSEYVQQNEDRCDAVKASIQCAASIGSREASAPGVDEANTAAGDVTEEFTVAAMENGGLGLHTAAMSMPQHCDAGKLSRTVVRIRVIQDGPAARAGMDDAYIGAVMSPTSLMTIKPSMRQ